MNQNEALEKIFKTAKVVGYILSAGLLFYAGIVEFISARPDIAGKTIVELDPKVLNKIFLILCAVVYIICVYIKKYYLRKASAGGAQAVTSLYISSVSVLMLCQVPAVLGLVLFFSGGTKQDFYVLLAVSALMFVIFFPKFNEWQKVFKPRQ